MGMSLGWFERVPGKIWGISGVDLGIHRGSGGSLSGLGGTLEQFGGPRGDLGDSYADLRRPWRDLGVLGGLKGSLRRSGVLWRVWEHSGMVYGGPCWDLGWSWSSLGVLMGYLRGPWGVLRGLWSILGISVGFRRSLG